MLLFGAHSEGTGVVLPTLRVKYLYKLCGILLYGRFDSSPHLFIDSVTYINLDSWVFIFCGGKINLT